MSQSGRRDADGELDAASAAAAVADAPFVRIVTRASGDAVAAAGLLGRVLSASGTPFQVSVGRTREGRTRRVEDSPVADTCVVVGDSNATDVVALDAADEPASVGAWRLAGELGVTADSVLALVGVAAAGVTPGAGSSARLVESAETSGRLDRRPGVAGPVDDVVDTLAHSTLLHASFSGDTNAARQAVDALDDTASDGSAPDGTAPDGTAPDSTAPDGTAPDDDAPVDDGAVVSGDLDDSTRRRVASVAAVSATGTTDAPSAAGDAIERALRPHVVTDADVPFATVAGYADVLDVLVEREPGTAVAVALGHDVTDGAVSAWRDHAARAHRVVEECDRSRHDGLVCVHDVDAPVSTTARLVRDYRSPEPVVAAFDDDATAVGIAGSRHVDVGDVLGRVTTQTGGEYDGTPTRGYATLDCDTDTFVTALREEL